MADDKHDHAPLNPADRDRSDSKDRPRPQQQLKTNNLSRFLRYYFGGLFLVFLMETFIFAMSYSHVKSVWGLLVWMIIWVCGVVGLWVWFSFRDDAAHDDEDARRVPLTVSELFLFSDPPARGRGRVPDVDDVAYKRHSRRVRHVRICIVVMLATFTGILLGFGACQFLEKYWDLTRPAANGSPTIYENVNAATDPTTMKDVHVIYFLSGGDSAASSSQAGCSYSSNGGPYCAAPVTGGGGGQVFYWAVDRGCCGNGADGRLTSYSCDLSGTVGVVVDRNANYDNAVKAATTANSLENSSNSIYVKLWTYSAFVHYKYMLQVGGWCVYALLPLIWPAGLVFVLLFKLILDSCGCSGNADDPDRCKCCSS